MALCWGPQCSWTAFIKLDKSSQQNEILAFSWHCVLTLGLPERWTENRNKHVGAGRSGDSAGWAFIHFIAAVLFIRSSNEDNKLCGPEPGWSLYETLFSIFTSPAARWGHL